MSKTEIIASGLMIAATLCFGTLIAVILAHGVGEPGCLSGFEPVLFAGLALAAAGCVAAGVHNVQMAKRR